MRVYISNWTLSKSKRHDEDDKVIPIRMIANKLTLDRENQEILPSAFGKATVEKFLADGIIDWFHQSVLAKTQEEKAKAVLGKPIDFQWENDPNGEGALPVVYGNLTKANPIVRESILPHLEADQPVFGASVGGSVRKARRVFDKAMNKAKDQIMEIDWNHIAIAPAPYVVSSGSMVSMVKAVDGAADIRVEFSDVGSFVADSGLIFREDEIRKAMEMGAGTDIATLTGADAVRQQSLAGGGNMYRILRDEVMFGIQDGTIKPSVKGVTEYLSRRGLNNRQITIFTDAFRRNVRSILAGV